MAMVAKLWTQNGLATELGKANKTVGKLLTGIDPDGKGHGGADAWLMKTAVAALMNGSVPSSEKLDGEQERARKDKELADAKAMDNEVRRGQLLERADVDMAVMAAFARVRAKLLAIPSKAAPLVVQGMDAAEIEHLLRSQVSKTLQELSETDVAKLEDNHGALVEGADAAT